MINDFIQHLKNIDVFENYIENEDVFDEDFLLNGFILEVVFNFKSNTVDFNVFKDENGNWIKEVLSKNDSKTLESFLLTLKPEVNVDEESEDEIITNYYDYFGVQPQQFI